MPGGAGRPGHGWRCPGAATCGKLAVSGGPAAVSGVSQEAEESKGSAWAQTALLVPPPMAAHVQKPAPSLSLCLVGGEKPSERMAREGELSGWLIAQTCCAVDQQSLGPVCSCR